MYVVPIGLVQEVWGQAAASLIHVTLPLKLQLPEQHALNSPSCDFDITCKLAVKSKLAVVLRLLEQLEKCRSSNEHIPVQFSLQVCSQICFDIILLCKRP
jgi:hypothetical protein